MIFWGSQSGTAEGFVTRLAREIYVRFGAAALTADLSDYDPESIGWISDAKLAVFIIATYGEGDPSDNTACFWDWITKSSDIISLPNLRYVAFGLGNRNYKHYNRVIDVVADRLDRAQAKSMLPVCRADDSKGGTQEDFMEWKEPMFTLFSNEFGYEEKEMAY